MVKVVMSLFLVAGLGTCSNLGLYVGLPCTVGPFIPDRDADKRWTVSEQAQLVALNNTGARLCHWQPPNKTENQS